MKYISNSGDTQTTFLIASQLTSFNQVKEPVTLAQFLYVLNVPFIGNGINKDLYRLKFNLMYY